MRIPWKGEDFDGEAETKAGKLLLALLESEWVKTVV